MLAFTRLMTHPQVCENPLSVAQVRDIVLNWLDYPQVRLLQVAHDAAARYFDVLEQAGTGGNLSTDALIALHVLQYSATLYSNDHDFDRFLAIRRINPLRQTGR